MASKKKKNILILVNNVCDFSWPLARKLDGGKGTKFVKGEHFEVDAEIERTKIDSEGHPMKVMVPVMELVNQLFPHQISEVKNAVSSEAYAQLESELEELRSYATELESENKALKAEVEKLKK